MAYVSYGETDWDESSNKKSEFLKLKTGEDDENQVRLITKPHKFGTHHVKFPDDPNKKNGGGRRVRCAGEKNGCVLCAIAKAQANDSDCDTPNWAKGLIVAKMKPRWYIGVIARGEAKPIGRILEIGGLIRGRLKELSNNKKWGDPRNYDITIKVNGGTVPAEYYSVDGDPDNRGPLEENLVKIAEDFVASANLVERCNPVSNEDVQALVENYREWINKAKEETGKKKPAPAKKQQAEATNEEEETEASDNFGFKTVQES